MSNESFSVEDLLPVAEQMLDLAKRAGTTSADVVVGRSTEFEVKVADQKIDTLTQATSKGLGLRVFLEGRAGFCTTSDFSKESLEALVTRSVAMTREVEEDPFNGLASVEPGRWDAGDELEIYDPAIMEVDTDTKIRWALELESAARSASPHVTRFRNSGVANGESAALLATSDGVIRSSRSTNIAAWANPIAERDGELQTEVWYDSKTHLEDLESLESIGRTAGERAARMLGARPIKTQTIPVIFEPPMAAGFLAGILGAVNGDMVFKNSSFLTTKLGEQIAAPGLTVVDDPLLRRGLASTPFDGEGHRTFRKPILEEGVLKTFLYDSYTARKAGVQSTGNGRRSYASTPHIGAFNFYVEPGETSPQDILSSVPRAFLMTRGMGSGVSPVTGEYSRGANGFWVENGELCYPVQEVTIAGDFINILKNIDCVGSDLQMRGTTGAPTLRVAEMTLSGT
jgi:PmbA protein